ncbi:MAG: hypothetical protein NC177_07605 [Ruminococcus flavefaciens]|nr:hypothetical protein [Ruminococcus flavefaciens]
MSLKIDFQVEALQARANFRAVRYSEDSEFTYLTIDGCRAMKIPKRSFFLDKSKLNKSDELADILNVNVKDLYRLTDTGYRRLYMPKGEAVCFECEISDEKYTIYCDAEALEKLSVKGVEFFTDKHRTTVYLVNSGAVYAVMIKMEFREPEEI